MKWDLYKVSYEPEYKIAIEANSILSVHKNPPSPPSITL